MESDPMHDSRQETYVLFGAPDPDRLAVVEELLRYLRWMLVDHPLMLQDLLGSDLTQAHPALREATLALIEHAGEVFQMLCAARMQDHALQVAYLRTIDAAWDNAGDA